MNILKKHLINQEDLCCDDYEDKIDDLNRCVASLTNILETNILRNTKVLDIMI